LKKHFLIHHTATPYFITYGTPKLDELDSTIVDERRVDYHERDDPLDESGSVVRSKNSKSDYDLASLETISAQPHMSPELSGTSFGNDLLLARCNQLLRSWVQTKIEEYPLLLLLENFHFEGILIDMDKSIDPSNLTLEFSLKRWIQHENKDICARCMSSTDESLCIGGILASAEITNQRINNCQERLLDFLEQDPVEHECLFTTIRTYSNLLKLYAIQCGDRHPSTCRFKVALVQFYLRHRQHNLSSLLSEVESFLTTTITNAREVKDPYLQFKWQVILAGCHVRKNRFREAINILLGYSFTDYLTMNSAVVSRIKRFDAQILCMHPDRPEVESKLMSSLASFSDESPYRNPILCRRSIAESINRVSKLVEKKPSVRFWSNKDHFNLRTEIATIAGIISKLGFDHEAQSLFRTLINAADPEDINTEEVMDLWNVKIYTHVLHYVHGIDSNFTKEQFKEKKALCSSLMHQAANFFTTNYLKGNMVHGTVVEKFNELQDMFAGLSPIESFSEGDRSGRIGDLQSQEESRTELFPQMALSLWSDWDKNDGLEDLHIDGFSGFSELPQNDPNIILSLPVVPTVAWNESGELEDVIAPLERIAAASTSSGYQASRSKGSIISGSRMSTNSTSSGMKSIKYGVTYSDGSVMSLDLTELFP
jgi:hypothetical protein